MSSSISEIPFEITQIRDKENHIVMYGKELAFLKETWEMLAIYRKTIDEGATLGEFKCEPLGSSSAQAKKGMAYSVCLDEILPPLVRALYGVHPANRAGGNCHGAALVATGIFPVMYCFSRATELLIVEKKTDPIPVDQLACGDLVHLSKFTNVTHSFVFISHSICISMNGSLQPLTIDNTATMLRRFHYPADCLRSPPNKDYPIEIFRKKKDWHYPKEVTSSLIAFYNFEKSSYMEPASLNHEVVKELVKLTQSYALRTDLSEDESQAARAIFRILAAGPLIPRGIADFTSVPDW